MVPAPPLPFGPGSRTGFELELLAPQGKSRFDLALALADGDRDRLRFGFKYFHQNDFDARGRPICLLTPAYRALDEAGAVLATVVDDCSIRAELREGLEPAPGSTGQTDDVRLAKWIEARCWSTADDFEARLAPMAELFDGRWSGEPEAAVLVDPYGHPLVRRLAELADARRVCEVVTRPLGRDERGAVLERVLSAARATGCTLPLASALHLHLDRAPWMSTARLSTLLLRAHADRQRLRETLQTNPRSNRLGPTPPEALRVAREAPSGLPFAVFAAALVLAGVSKYCDLNVLGAVEAFPVQPTVEVRFLPMSLEPATVLARVEAVEAFLLRVARAAPGG